VRGLLQRAEATSGTGRSRPAIHDEGCALLATTCLSTKGMEASKSGMSTKGPQTGRSFLVRKVAREL
jgi:hypothetical protein